MDIPTMLSQAHYPPPGGKSVIEGTAMGPLSSVSGAFGAFAG
jgi:hypothetical protein